MKVIELHLVPDTGAGNGSTTTTISKGSDTSPTLDALLQTSKDEAAKGTKVFRGNADPGDLASQYGLTSDNCVQVAKLSSGATVVDFAAGKCPEGAGLLNPDLIRATLYYRVETDDTSYYEVLFSEDKALGHAQVDFQTQSAAFRNLCNGDYSGRCTLKVTNGQFDSLILN